MLVKKINNTRIPHLNSVSFQSYRYGKMRGDLSYFQLNSFIWIVIDDHWNKIAVCLRSFWFFRCQSVTLIRWLLTVKIYFERVNFHFSQTTLVLPSSSLNEVVRHYLPLFFTNHSTSLNQVYFMFNDNLPSTKEWFCQPHLHLCFFQGRQAVGFFQEGWYQSRWFHQLQTNATANIIINQKVIIV